MHTFINMQWDKFFRVGIRIRLHKTFSDLDQSPIYQSVLHVLICHMRIYTRNTHTVGALHQLMSK